ncbi:MAG: Isocitrate dehydrogenase [NADP] (EC; Monomeric isocitrate dehydrogenase [NADP] (EC [uncultured Campylobacterales bacterium]|uniref:isocitrate dehydrogenase (NADP(+)) n=1 Tax=uncultured Campylobacterales bacterium TaxID=352960 RepID=A0A6S6SA26_9BACT|nr:MAG: Isocitrate dehydrogenase [NADP] (EC; Monomeric isocitrate dehydrogenase [NADP] (EC [uncultured Campylobacterales bacterium]
MAKIIWTKVDEAPALASYSLYPIIKSFISTAGIDLELRDISLSSRILSLFSENLKPEQQKSNDLEYLGKLVTTKEANIIKLPNISASVSQLKSCIDELQKSGYDIPNFPEDPETKEELDIRAKYAKCLGSAVNPVLREGNSDRRAAKAVKNFAKNNPHKLKNFDPNPKFHISYMNEGDFYDNEESIINKKSGKVSIELHTKDGVTTLKDNIDIEDKEIIDATFMSASKLKSYYKKEILNAKENDMLLSLHLKATMMKVSDPIMFGYAIESYFDKVFDKYSDEFEKAEINPNLGLSDILKKIDTLTPDTANKIKTEIQEELQNNASLAMVDRDKGITNFHASNYVIIDASLPVILRDGGKMWNKEGNLQETKALVPDKTYARMYEEIFQDCKSNGQFDVVTMGNVSNVGLMAKKAEEYGSHPTTFQISNDGEIKVVGEDGNILLSHNVEVGDIYRVVRTKDEPIKDWLKLALKRAKITKDPVIFWLDKDRPHDANIISKIKTYINEFDTTGVEYDILSPALAMKATLKRVRNGLDTISATGNVLRDYLTDLFPILELGSSSKMLSVVPLLQGGGLFETGAGGSAPKHVEQFLESGHLRWDSLGEFLALAESLRFINENNPKDEIEILLNALDDANNLYLENNNSPSRKVGEPDNKASHYYLALYWSKAIASQNDNKNLANKFLKISNELESNEKKILEELLKIEGNTQNINGYFNPDFDLVSSAMRPSETFNKIIKIM